MKLSKFKRNFQRFWRWYVLGYYHCDRCPYSWDDASPSCEDCDCGCVIFGDIRDTCRLLPPFRFLIGWAKKKQFQYAKAHEYDDLATWYMENQSQEAAMVTSISDSLKRWHLTLHHTADDGSVVPVADQEAEIEVVTHWVVDEYERQAHPVQHFTLRQEWGMLIRKTWKRFVLHFAPYFTKC